jgi:hypothetical protein
MTSPKALVLWRPASEEIREKLGNDVTAVLRSMDGTTSMAKISVFGGPGDGLEYHVSSNQLYPITAKED